MKPFKTSLFSLLAAVTLLVGLQATTGIELENPARLAGGSSDASSLFTVAEMDPPSGEQPGDRSGSPSLQPLLDFNDAVVEITERANPTVVTITTSRTVRQRMQSPFSLFFDDPRFDQEREFQQNGLGSGVIVSTEGYILTNNHVIEGADEIRIRTYEGEEMDAEVVGTDPESDVAVLRVDETGLPAITIGDSDRLRVGELVLAIGSPLRPEFAHSVSMGMVSAKGRSDLRLSSYENYIQTDAAINPGNSGGALINAEGHLVGINTAIASRSGGNQGIGFAIPINMARSIMESLIEDGRVVRSYLGITQGALVDDVMARALGLDVNYGVVIGDVTEDSPAEKGGLAEGDVLTHMNGEPIRDWSQFRLGIAHLAPGTEVEFDVFREGEMLERTVTLEERPDDFAQAGPVDEGKQEELQESLGFSITGLNDNLRSQLNLEPNDQGVVVTDVSSGSRAQRQGLSRGDLIFQVQKMPVSNESEFYQAIDRVRSSGEDVVLLRIKRQGTTVFIAFELE